MDAKVIHHCYYTPLMISCKTGHISEVQKLRKAGADINLKIGSKTFLSAAYEHGQLHIMEEFVKPGVGINNVPLYVASGIRQSGIIETLKEEGAKVVFRKNRHQENMFFDMNLFFQSISISLDESKKKLQRLSQIFQRPMELHMRMDKKKARNKKIIARNSKCSKTYEITNAIRNEHISFN